VLERLPASGGDGAHLDQFETAYLQFIARRFDRLELFGLDFATQWYPLSVAYVDLNVSIKRRPRDEPGDQGTETIEHSLDVCPRLLIDGGAGSGKTTILQWIAVHAALREFPGPAAALNGYVPFLFPLRGYAGQALPGPEEFLDKAAPCWHPRHQEGGFTNDCSPGGRSS